MSELEALHVFHLAPLTSRRDIAMLGLVHRTVLRQGPQHFKQFFRLAPQKEAPYGTRAAVRKHSRQLQDIRSSGFLEMERRSALGLPGIYNLLPEDVVHAPTVSAFQSSLQKLLKERASSGCTDWPLSFSPRIPLFKHPLR